ncbi:hypothetical protein PHYPSEUDO_000578 [Phytophthora pseudosyringae]|uniref:Uncharacterized protein n=1 Tax=Phytophthora pseudosyringae TaxID=221518 RepID=A0A8T1VYY3_9STRA|nr:hypothetical protein PHYPSEUDO_000578 [Phytophthora pseudosyringae]
MNPERPRGVPSQRQQWEDFVQFVSTCEALHEREKAALRAQVHDLTELLAAFDLCEIEDVHLSAVRDRAFRRDIAQDAELRLETLVRELEEEPTQQTSAANDHGIQASDVPGQLDGSLSVSKRQVASLQLRVEGLERDVANLRLRHDLILETAPGLKHPAVKTDADTDASCPQPCAGNDIIEMDAQRRAEADTILEKHEVPMKSVQGQQQQRILELETALAAELTKNAELAQQSCRYEEVEKILKEFSRSR